MSGLSRPQVRPEELGLGALFRLTHDAVIVVDLATDRVALLNGAAERLLGYTSLQAAHLPIERLVPLSERLGMHALVHGVLHRPSAEGTECRILGVCGQERWVELTAHPIEGAACALLVCHDVTERRLAEARRREQARVEGMLQTIETLGRVLDQELAQARADLQRVLAERHVPAGVRVLGERARQRVVRALGLLDELRLVGQVEAMELTPGAEDLFAPVTLAPVTDPDGDEGGKQVSRQPTEAGARPARLTECSTSTRADRGRCRACARSLRVVPAEGSRRLARCPPRSQLPGRRLGGESARIGK